MKELGRKNVLTFAYSAYHLLMPYVIIGFAQNSAGAGGRDEDVVGSGKQLVKGDAGNIVEVSIISGEALTDQPVQLQKPVVVLRNQNTVVIILDLFR